MTGTELTREATMTNQQDTALLPVAEEAPWWRLKPGLSGLKRFMPDRIVQSAKAKGLGWIKHYEPVCADCPRIAAEQAKPSASGEAGEVERLREVLGRLFNICDRNPHAQSVIRAALASGAGDEG